MPTNLARAAIVCLAFAFSTTALAGGGGGGAAVSLVVGQDRMGGDYKGFPLAQPDAQQCRQACADDAACKAYTYVKPGIKGPQAMCFLKSSVVPATADACCTSGAKGVASIANARATKPPVRMTVPMRVAKSAQQIADDHAAAEKAKNDAYEANQQFLQEGYEAAADEAQAAHDAHQCEVATAAAVAPKEAYKQAFDKWLAASGAVSAALKAFMASIDTGGVCDSGGCDDAYYLANYPSYQAVMDLVPAANAAKAEADALAKPADDASYAAWQACHPQ
jgi:hypothetical protein